MKLSKVLLPIFILVFPMLCSAEVMNLDTFLRNVLIQYHEISQTKEIIEFEKQIENSSDPARISVSDGFSKRYDNSSTSCNITTANDANIAYHQKIKYGPNIYAYSSGRQNFNSPPVGDFYSNIMSLNLSQNLFRELFAEFYHYKEINLKYESQEALENEREKFILYSAMEKYLDYLKLNEDITQTKSAITFLEQTISQVNNDNKNRLKKINIAHLTIEKKNLEFLLENTKSQKNDLKYQLISLIAKEYNSVIFQDKHLTRDYVLQRYKAYRNNLYQLEKQKRKVNMKLQKLKIKQEKNDRHPSIRLTADGSIRKRDNKFFKSFNFFKAEIKSYSIGVNTGINLFDKGSRLEIKKEELLLKTLKKAYDNLLIEEENKHIIDENQIKIRDKQIKISEEKIADIKNQLDLQKDYILELLNSQNASQKDTDYEISKFITFLNHYKDEKTYLFAQKLSWVEKLHYSISYTQNFHWSTDYYKNKSLGF